MTNSVRRSGGFLACAAAGLAMLALAPTAMAGEATDAQPAKTLCQPQTYAMGLRYQQRSAEVAALQHQGFALARARLAAQIKAHDAGDKLAIVTDLDETVLDNTPLLVRDMKACHDYTAWDTWGHWERKGKPTLTPGALDFLEYADEQGVTIYYISNRLQENKQATIATLEALGLPQVSSQTVLLYGPPKTERRSRVREDHTVVLLLGDSLADFSGAFADASVTEQRDRVAKHASEFGKRWIVFPNAAYGDWDEAELEGWDAPMEIDD